MIRYLKAFVDKMGPIGFGLGITMGLLAMLLIMLGAVDNGWGLAAGLAIGAVAAALAFFLIGTVIVAMRGVLRLAGRLLLGER